MLPVSLGLSTTLRLVVSFVAELAFPEALVLVHFLGCACFSQEVAIAGGGAAAAAAAASMANAVASMAGLSQGASLAGTRVVGSSRGGAAMAKGAPVVQVRASSEETQSRRAFFSLAAASLAATAVVQNARALESIKIFPPPPPSGGLPGTENADEARDTDLDLKKRFYLQSKTPAEAVARVKDAVKEVKEVKTLIEKKAWPYVQNGLRSSASYLRFDLNVIGSAKPKDQKKAFKALANKAYDALDSLDYAARVKSPSKASKAYSEVVAALDNVVSSI